jgi:signal peptidase I
MKKVLREIIITLLLAIVIVVITQATVQSSVVIGSSMEPNLHNGQRLLINKVVYFFHAPERGDVIVFTPPDSIGSENDYIKRIIGLPGEMVELKDGIVYIHQEDGTILTLDEEEFITFPSTGFFLGEIVLADAYFVLGDNRNNSNDSRGGWQVSLESIVGKAWISIWPMPEWGVVSDYDPQ